MSDIYINGLAYHDYPNHPGQPGLAMHLLAQVISHQGAGLEYHPPFPQLGNRLLIDVTYQIRAVGGIHGTMLARDLMFTNFSGGQYVVTTNDPHGAISVHVDYDAATSRYIDFKPARNASVVFEPQPILSKGPVPDHHRPDAPSLGAWSKKKNSKTNTPKDFLSYLASLFS